MSKIKSNIPSDGIKGLIENLTSDITSGFIVFLLALPLSLGIAKASEFPPLMGLVTAIIGGVVVSFFSGSKLTIKGPAAGLIVIVVSAVNEFGGGEIGWHLALGAIFVASIIQILFGVFKLGKLVDFFPLSTVHGMLAAIGIIIIIKQIPVLLDIDPMLTKGKSIIEHITLLPSFLQHLDPKASLIGLISLLIMMGWNQANIPFLSKIPAPLVVLFVAIPAQFMLDFNYTDPSNALVDTGSLINNIHLNVSFDGIKQLGVFSKFVVMFALVGSLESLLTVKAIDMMDPYKRKSNPNKDLIAIGIGNCIAAIFGGLPMISEVARSSANVNNGAKTRWANFFHGIFILLFMLFAIHWIELIPNMALAAMLISVGIKLSHPKEFVHIFKIGKEQLAIFIITILFTLLEDLLVGIAAGILLNTFIHIYHGAPINSLFKAPATVSFNDNNYFIEIEAAAIFSNFLGMKSRLEAIPKQMHITVDFSKTKLVDHSVIDSITQFQKEYTKEGGNVKIIGLENHRSLSNHPLSTKIIKK